MNKLVFNAGIGKTHSVTRNYSLTTFTIYSYQLYRSPSTPYNVKTSQKAGRTGRGCYSKYFTFI